MKHITFFLSIFTLIMTVQAQSFESYIVLDSESGKVLLANHTEKKRPVASLTKIATAKITLDWASVTNRKLSAEFRVPQSAATVTGANPLQLQPGDVLSLRDALYAALLSSDNVATHSLANFVGYSLNQRRGTQGDNIQSFVKEMNRLTKALGMKNTKFINPHGLDGPSSTGTSTATDMALLSMSAINNEALAFMVKQTSRKISVTRANGEKKKFTLKNTNTLLGKNGVVGLKTGLTASAGQCLITISNKQPIVFEVEGKKKLRPRQLLVVLLGSQNRFGKSTTLINEGWEKYAEWGKAGYLVSSTGEGLLKLPVPKAKTPEILPAR